jgi:uncharacterized protein with HEPN domain
MTRLRSVDNDTLERISERAAIIGFRNRLIHGYDLVDDEIVWKIVREKMPILSREVQALLEER